MSAGARRDPARKVALVVVAIVAVVAAYALISAVVDTRAEHVDRARAPDAAP